MTKTFPVRRLFFCIYEEVINMFEMTPQMVGFSCLEIKIFVKITRATTYYNVLRFYLHETNLH